MTMQQYVYNHNSKSPERRIRPVQHYNELTRDFFFSPKSHHKIFQIVVTNFNDTPKSFRPGPQ